MKKFFLLLAVIVTTTHGRTPVGNNPVFDILNQMHKFSSRYWIHQRERDIAAYSHEWTRPRSLRINHDHETVDESRRRLAQMRTDLPPFRVGPTVEAIGELADVATLASTSPTLTKLANSLAFITRGTGLVLGSFPQLARSLLDIDGNPTCDIHRTVETERPDLRFWPTAWLKTPGPIPSFMKAHVVTHLANQIGKIADIGRSSERINNAKILAWHLKRLSTKRKRKLNLEQLIHALAIGFSWGLKHYAETKHVIKRYPFLITESLLSLIRRLRMRHVQNNLLKEARDAWEEKELNEITANKKNSS